MIRAQFGDGSTPDRFGQAHLEQPKELDTLPNSDFIEI